MRDQNPFQPQLTSIPLLLTLDARSIPALAGEERERAAFLWELCQTPAVDGLWTWDAPLLSDDLPQTELRPQFNGSDDRAVGIIGEGGFIGGIAMWSSHERLADDIYELRGNERDWFMYYSTTTKFHLNARRHFYVTADRRLLNELREGTRQKQWQRGRVVSVPGALAIAGRAMRASERIYYQAESGYTAHVSPHAFYFYLGPDLAPSRIRLHRWLDAHTDSAGAIDLMALEQSMHDRVIDLLKARDHVALQNARHQNNATLDEILYHLRAAVGGAAALFDSLAVFAQIAFLIDPGAVGGMARVSLNNRPFRRELRRKGAPRIAAASAELAPLFKAVWSLRNVIMHGAGLSGTGYLRLDGTSASESRVHLSDTQADALDALAQQRREAREKWGVSKFGLNAQFEPEAFGSHFCLVAIEAAERLTRALADDLGAPEHEAQLSDDDKQMVRRFRWLAGIPSGETAATSHRPE